MPAVSLPTRAISRSGAAAIPIINPMRVVDNEAGTLLSYTCLQYPGMPDEKFESTIEWIIIDFLTLKSVLEI
ncbi:MAG: hypothetical protein Q8L54_05855 [Devosia sp.]|nr:hypothetical protein [Devosia sp.]